MKKTGFFIPLILLLLLAAACNKKQERKTTVRYDTVKKTIVVPVYRTPDTNAVLVADSIIYTVLIKNPDTLDQWQDYSLRYMNREKLLDMIFENIFRGKLKAYSYQAWLANEKQEISADSLKSWLQRIGKDRIGKIEFVERWFYNPHNNVFYKQVLEMTLGYELYRPDGSVKGYAPLIKISFNPADNQQTSK